MSGNTALIDELIDSGNSITQELRGQVSKQNTALVYSTFLNNTAKVFVQSQFRSTFDSYKSAGASLLTSSIVSTEASVQGRLIQELAKENVATLDVYDGIETLPIYRFKVGKLANNLVNGIHQNTSLVANFYEYALRGNLHNSLFQAIQSPNWKDTFKSFNERQPTIRVSGQTLQAIQTVLGSVGFMAQFYGNLPKEMKEAKQIEAKSRELLSNLINEISLTGNSFENATLALSAKDQALLSDAMKLTFSLRNVVPEMLDLYRQVLKPKGINPPRRTTELTISLIQLVASRRGIATVPYWAALPYLEKGYVVARKITEEGLYSNLYAAIRKEDANLAYIEDFHQTVKAQSFSTLPGLSVLEL